MQSERYESKNTGDDNISIKLHKFPESLGSSRKMFCRLLRTPDMLYNMHSFMTSRGADNAEQNKIFDMAMRKSDR